MENLWSGSDKSLYCKSLSVRPGFLTIFKKWYRNNTQTEYKQGQEQSERALLR